MASPEVLAIACVVDSSLSVAAEWSHIVSEYFIPMLQRLGEHYANRQFRLAIITYATAETRPTPLVSKLFFGPPAAIIAAMRDEPTKIGVGQTGVGGSRGMAALEGLIAAIEFFDSLRNTMEVFVNHLIHVAAIPTDTAERPLWNVTPSLDFVTWDTLPLELRKRDIHYSNILLKQLPRFPELHASAAAGSTQTPWFSVRPHHNLHLAGWPLSQQKGTKRPGEQSNGLNGSPELKRQRIISQPSQASPKSNNTAAPTAPPPVPTSTSNPAGQPASASAPAPAPAMAPTVPPQASPAHLLRMLETQLAQKMQQMRAAEAAGLTAEAAQIRLAMSPVMANRNRIRQWIEDRLREAQAQAPGQKSLPNQPSNQGHNQAQAAQPAPASTAEPAADQMAPTASAPQSQPLSSTSATDMSSFPDLQTGDSAPSVPPQAYGGAPFAAQGISAPHANSALQNGAAGLQVPPAMNAQLQKLVEQRNRGAQIAGAPADVSGSGAGMKPHPPAAGTQVVWQGVFTWTGFDSATKQSKEVQTQVAMSSHTNLESMRPNTWPTQLTLIPSKEPTAPLPILQDWIRRNNCQLIQVHTPQLVADQKVNDESFLNLARLLHEKSIYALAGWPNASGMNENRLLLVAAKPNQIMGACAPAAITELPKSEVVGIPLAQLPAPLVPMLMKLSTEQQALLMDMPLDRRLFYIRAIWMKQQQTLQQRQQAQGQGPGQPPSQPPHMQPPIQPQQMHGQPSQQQMMQQPSQMTQPQMGAPPPANMAPPLNMASGALQPFVNGQSPNIGAVLNSFLNQAAPNPAQSLNSAQSLSPAQGVNPAPSMSSAPSAQNMQNMNPAAMLNFNIGQGMGGSMGLGQMPHPGAGQGGGGMHRRTPSGGNAATGGLSYEMIQSFMQRNPDGSGGGGAGMG